MNQQRLQKFGRVYASFLPPNAFAGGKGIGKSKSKGHQRGQNPRGKEGQILKCHRCGATDHLLKRCPKVEGSSNLAMMTSIGTSSLQFHAVTHALNRENLQLAAARASSALVHGNVTHGVMDELESLRSVSSQRHCVESVAASETTEQADYSENPPPRCPPPSEPAPTSKDLQQGHLMRQQLSEWTTITTGSQGSHVGVRTHVERSTDSLLADMMRMQSKKPDVDADAQSTSSSQSLMRSPDRKSKRVEPNREEQKRARAVTTLQLTQLLNQMSSPEPTSNVTANASADVGSNAGSSSHAKPGDGNMFPWWETDPNATVSHAALPAYHARTNVDGRVGILVDPGAHDNLAGEETIRMLEMQLNTRARPRVLNSPLHVSGVGKESLKLQIVL